MGEENVPGFPEGTLPLAGPRTPGSARRIGPYVRGGDALACNPYLGRGFSLFIDTKGDLGESGLWARVRCPHTRQLSLMGEWGSGLGQVFPSEPNAGKWGGGVGQVFQGR